MIPLLEERSRQKSLQVFLVARPRVPIMLVAFPSLERHRNCLDYVISCIFIACYFLYLPSNFFDNPDRNVNKLENV